MIMHLLRRFLSVLGIWNFIWEDWRQVASFFLWFKSIWNSSCKLVSVLANVFTKMQFYSIAQTAPPVVLMAYFAHQHDRVLMQVVAFDLTHQLIGRLQLLQGLLLGSHICWVMSKPGWVNQDEDVAPGNGKVLQGTQWCQWYAGCPGCGCISALGGRFLQ